MDLIIHNHNNTPNGRGVIWQNDPKSLVSIIPENKCVNHYLSIQGELMSLHNAHLHGNPVGWLYGLVSPSLWQGR
jgi:hypothetical protein